MSVCKEAERSRESTWDKSDNVGMVQWDYNYPTGPARLLFVYLQIQLDKS